MCATISRPVPRMWRMRFVFAGAVRLWLFVGLDGDLTVTKHACVSLRWHWSTVLVNWNVFRIWLMCFLPRPVTHTCGGCDVLVIKIRVERMIMLPQNAAPPPKNTASSFETTDEKWQDDAKDKKAMRFHSLVHFVGAYPHTDAKGGGELVHSTSLESEAAAWISMTSPQFWFRKKVLPGQADKRCRYSEIAVRRGLRMLIYFHCLIFAFVFQLIKNEATNPGTEVTPEKTACFCLSNNPD